MSPRINGPVCGENNVPQEHNASALPCLVGARQETQGMALCMDSCGVVTSFALLAVMGASCREIVGLGRAGSSLPTIVISIPGLIVEVMTDPLPA